MARIIVRLLPLALLLPVFPIDAGAQQPDRPAILNVGNAVVTGFSGTLAPDPAKRLPAGKTATDLTFIDPEGPSARIVDIGNPGFVWDGRVWAAAKPVTVSAKDVGQVFGVALDDQAAPNAYLAATSAFGLNIVGRGADGLPERKKKGLPGAGWMKGQFGLDLQGGPGSLYKVDGRTGVAILFANVMLDGVPNPGPGLGNIAYDSAHKQLFVSDLYTGMIHRFAILDGSEGGAPYDHGVTGRAAANMPPMPFNPANRLNITNARFDSENTETWGFAPPERRVWGLAVHEGRLFYSARNGAASEGPQIWSVGIARDGSFAPDVRWELDVPAQPAPYAVSDIAFSQKGAMILAQRAPIAASYDYSAFTKPAEPRVLRFWLENPDDPNTPSRWIAVPEAYAIGFAGSYNNTNGGVALGYGYDQAGRLSTTACEFALWTTAQNMRNAPALQRELQPGGPLVLHGIYGVPAGPVRSFNEPPWISYSVDYDDKADDPRALGHMGSLRILTAPCTGPVAAYGGPGYASNPPYISGPVTPVSCVGPNCPQLCTPTCMCPTGTVLKDGKCVPPEICPPPQIFNPATGSCTCPPGMVLRGKECVKVVFDLCPPPMIPNGGEACGCPQGTVLIGGKCVPQTCTPPMVPGPVPGVCVCPPGTVQQQGGACVPRICPPPLVPGAVPGTCVCPPGTVQQGGACVPQVCPPPMVPGPCECPPGTVQDGGLCVPTNICPPPLVPGAVPGTCVCPPGTLPDGKECVPTKPIDLEVGKENTPHGGSGTWFNLWVTNRGAPITFGVDELVVTDAIPAGMTVLSLAGTNPNWNCTPLPVFTGPQNLICKYHLAGSLLTNQSLPAAIFINYSTKGPGPWVNCATISNSPSVGVDTNPKNNTACVTVTETRVGSLLVKKTTANHTALPINTLVYPVTVTCGGTTTTGTVTETTPFTVTNIPVPSTCTVTEGAFPTLPPNICPAGFVPTWAAPTYTPPSVVIAAGATATITIHNDVHCEKIVAPDKIDLAIEKTGGTSPVPQVNAYAFHLKVTNVGQAFNGNNVITVTDVAPAGMTFNTATGPNWTCVTLPVAAGGTMTCTYTGTGPTGPNQSLGTIDVTATASGAAPFPPFTNCARVALLPAPGREDSNAGNNEACVTVTKPPAVCSPPLVPGPIPGVCVCKDGQVLKDGKCVRPIECRPPLIPNAAGTACVCREGLVQKNRECVLPVVCTPPKIPNAAGTACGCQSGFVERGRECVRPISCESPAFANKAGTACLCPRGFTLQGRTCVRIQREEPRGRPGVDPGDVIRSLPGLLGPGGGGHENPNSGGGGGRPGVGGGGSSGGGGFPGGPVR